MRPRDAAAFAIGPIATGSLAIAAVPLLANLSSSEDISRYYLLQTIVALATVAATLGLDQAFVREYAGADSRPSLFRSTLTSVGLVIVGICGVVGVFGSTLSVSLFSARRTDWALLMLVAVVAAVASRVFSLPVRLEKRGITFSVGQVLPKLSLVIALLVYWWSGRDLIGFSWLATSLAVGYLASLFLYMLSSWGLTRLALGTRGMLHPGMLRYGLPLAGASVLLWIQNATAPWALRSTGNFQELAYYSLAMTLAGAALVLQSVFGTLWAPAVFEWVAAGRVGVAEVRSVTSAVAALVVFVAASVGALSPMAGLVLPAEYQPVSALIVGAMIPALGYTLAEVVGIGIFIARKPRVALVSTFVSTCVTATVVLLAAVQLDLGAAGVICGNVIGMMCYVSLRAICSRRVWRPIGAGWGLVAFYVCCFISMGQAITGDLHWSIHSGLWTAFGLTGAIAARSYLGSNIRRLLSWKASGNGGL